MIINYWVNISLIINILYLIFRIGSFIICFLLLNFISHSSFLLMVMCAILFIIATYLQNIMPKDIGEIDGFDDDDEEN